MEWLAAVGRCARVAASNRQLLRVELAFAAFNGAEWSVWVAMLVYAYDRAGGGAAGLMALVQLTPSALLSPVLGALADRHRPGRIMLAGYLVQAGAMAAVAVAIAAGAPPAVVFALAPVMNLGVTVPRPAQAVLLPWVARSAHELA